MRSSLLSDEDEIDVVIFLLLQENKCFQFMTS